MARPREFEISDALEKAMEAFWAKGYEATSMVDLMKAMNAKTSQPTKTWMMDAMPANAVYDQWVMR